MKTGRQIPGLGTWATGRRQRGAASLVIVLMLFFVVSLVAAYTSRNLIFEQRTSVNQYRSSMAFETADAGLEWVVAMLNGGRIGDDCTEASATPTSTSFRQRYLAIAADGMVTPRVQPTSLGELRPTCVWNGTQWRCSCPSDSAPALAAVPGGGLNPAFRLRFVTDANITRPGVVRVEVNGCIKLGTDPNNDACLNDFTDLPVESEGRSQHVALVALKSALTTPPAAAFTVVGEAVALGAAMRAENTDPAHGGITLHVAGPLSGSPTLIGVAGTPGERTSVRDDPTLVPDGLALPDLSAAPVDPLKRDRVFASFFGVLPDTHRNQPAAVALPCPNTGCRQALTDLVARSPGRVIWIPGNLTLETAGDIGSMPNPADPTVAGPASIVVGGEVRVTNPGVNIYGVVYARSMAPLASSDAWQGGGTVRGAVITEAGITGAASPNVIYDKAVIDSVRRNHGSFVRLPGDWRDFKAWRP